MAEQTTYKKRYIETIIISFDEGFRIFHNVKLIRIKGKGTNLLVMLDYMPTVGEVDGTVEILAEDDVTIFENVRGFYVIKNNVFKLLMKEEELYDGS